MPNEYNPWEDINETEVAYYKRRFLEESARGESLEDMLEVAETAKMGAEARVEELEARLKLTHNEAVEAVHDLMVERDAFKRRLHEEEIQEEIRLKHRYDEDYPRDMRRDEDE